MQLVRYSFLSVLLVASFSLSAFAQLPDSIGIDIIIRDFHPGHPDFENFASRSADKNGCEDAPLNDPSGNPLLYGKYNYTSTDGTVSVPDTLEHRWKLEATGTINGMAWEQHVKTTSGMILPTLDGNLRPIKNADKCDNSMFVDWFNKTADASEPYISNPLLKNYEIRDVVWMYKKEGTFPVQYEINSGSAGFFPLDKYHAFAGSGDPLFDNWGKQSYKTWCPPGAANESDDFVLCTAWLADGGAKSGNIDPAHEKAHNYGFTMEGHTSFTYNGGEVFTFSGDDDMWIFIDGYLAADLGGVHLPAPAEISMDQLAGQAWSGADWSAGSVHTLDFFYADRQSDGSNLIITTTMADVKETEFSDLKLLSAESFGLESPYVSVYVNAQFSQAVIDMVNNGLIPDAFVLSRGDSVQVVQENFRVIKIEVAKGDPETPGYEYRVYYSSDGAIPVNNDKISLNEATVSGATMESVIGRGVTFRSWVTIERNVSAANLKVIPIETESVAEKLPFDIGGLQSGAAGNTPNPVINTATGLVPLDMGIEFYLTPIPPGDVTAGIAGWESNGGDASWGMPPSTVGNGSDDPRRIGELNVGMGVVGTSSDNPAEYKSVVAGSGLTMYCQGSVSTGITSCLDFVFKTDQAFSMNITMFDHTGQFIRSYSREVSQQAIDAAQQAAWGGAPETLLDENGVSVPGVKWSHVNVHASIYPISQEGRLIGSGVYILKVDMLMRENNYYLQNGVDPQGQPVFSPASRQFKVLKVPYMRPLQ